MLKIKGKNASFFLVIFAICICSSCDYQSEFDPLSAYPANNEMLSAEEMDFDPIVSESRSGEKDRESSEPASIKPAEIVIQKGVKAYPFRFSLAGGDKFTQLDSIATGFRVSNSSEIELKNAEQLWSPFTAAGIAIGDIDNDNLPDIFVANRESGGRLFKNVGGMTFKDVTASYQINIKAMWGTAPVFGDINDDGLLDLYLCGYDSPNRLFINRGSKFKEQSERLGLNFSGASAGATFADYDRDGDLDLFLVTGRLTPKTKLDKLPIDLQPDQPPQIKLEHRERNHMIQHRNGNYRPVESGQYDHLFRNDGYRFVDVTSESKIGNHPLRGMSAVWCDINNDLWPDLYVSNNHKDPDQLFRNDGPDENGVVTFSEIAKSAFTRVPWFSKGVDFGDLNNDGMLDLVATGTAGHDQYSKRTSTGNMYGQPGDGWFLNWGSPQQVFENTVSLNTANSKFVDIAPMAGLSNTNWTWSVRIADFDNDGFSDVILANGKVRDFLNNDLERERRTDWRDSKGEFWIDKKPVGIVDRAFRNLGDLKFEDTGLRWGFGEETVSQILATGDLDKDGDLDLVVGGFGEDVRVYRNDLRRRNAIRIKLSSVSSNSFGIGARLRLQISEGGPVQVQYLNPTRGFQSTSEHVIHFGVGDAGVVHLLEIDWPSGTNQKLFNLKSNYHYRIDEPGEKHFVNTRKADKQTPTLFSKGAALLPSKPIEELEFDDFEFQPLIPFQHSRMGPALSWADIDGDGDYDFFRGGAAFDQGAVFKNSGQMRFEKMEQDCFRSSSRSEDLGSVFFDADNDKDLDLYVVSGGVEFKTGGDEYLDRLYINDGTGRFELSAALPEIRNSGSCVSVTDFDGDGRLDLFVGGRVQPGRYPETPRSYLLKNTEDGFIDVTSSAAPELENTGMVTASVWADINDDNQPDLLVCHEWGPVKCFQNLNGKLAEISMGSEADSRTGFYNSICVGDVDNDGDSDFVIGNLGLNTSYQADDKNAVQIFEGGFGKQGEKQIVEAAAEDGILYPRRSLDTLLQHIPSLQTRFPTSSEFARASLEDVFSKQQLSAANILNANSLASIVLVNDSDADGIKFSVKQLPRLAQASPIYGSQLCDIDGDSDLDLYVIQNNSNVFWETPTFVAGASLLMRGNGVGDFEAVFPSKSGLEVPGNGTSLTTVDLNQDSRPDFVAATNNDGIKTFLNNSRHKSFMLDLSEINDGRSYPGVKVVLEFFDGSKQLHQIASQSGYLSQSPAIIYSGSDHVSKIHVRWPDGTTKSGSVEDFTAK